MSSGYPAASSSTGASSSAKRPKYSQFVTDAFDLVGSIVVGQQLLEWTDLVNLELVSKGMCAAIGDKDWLDAFEVFADETTNEDHDYYSETSVCHYSDRSRHIYCTEEDVFDNDTGGEPVCWFSLSDYLAEEDPPDDDDSDEVGPHLVELVNNDGAIAKRLARDFYFVQSLEQLLNKDDDIKKLHGMHPIFSDFFNTHGGNGNNRVFDLKGFWYPGAYICNDNFHGVQRFSEAEGPDDFWEEKLKEMYDNNNDLEMRFDLPRLNNIEHSYEEEGEDLENISSEYLDRMVLADESFVPGARTPIRDFEPYTWAACDHDLGTRVVSLNRADYNRDDSQLDKAVRKFYDGNDRQLQKLKERVRARIRKAYEMIERRNFVKRFRIRIYEPGRGQDEEERDWACELILGETEHGDFLGFSVLYNWNLP